MTNDVGELAAGLTVISQGSLQWQTFDYLLLATIPLLLIGSALFSGSETALFGMSESDRLHFRRRRTLIGRAVELLLSDRRMLLITLMLGNMTVNALYFVISSVLILHSGGEVLIEGTIALLSLLVIILFGEVLPKMIATSRRIGVISVVAPVLLAIHEAILPIRIFVERLVVSPLSRLTAPAEAPPRLDEEELQALLQISGDQGVIDAEEQRILREVFTLSRLKVRDVMTPRVHMEALVRTATRADVLEMTRRERFTKLPVYGEDLDDILGMLHVKRYLLDPRSTIEEAMTPVRFVPLVITLDQLLDEFRRTHEQSVIVVDEFGGTAGIVAIHDLVEELVGEIVGEDEIEIRSPRLVGLNCWEVSGEMSVHDWAEAFGQRLISPAVSTLGGLIMQRLGRAPTVGDSVDLGNVRIEVESVVRSRVVSALITLVPPGSDESEQTS